MKIKYKALWIEDQFDKVESYIDGIGDRLKDNGFQFDVERKTSLTEEELESLSIKLSHYNPYDMIFFDYDLGKGNQSGAEIAGILRNRIFTDMIFYSGISSEDLRTVLYNTGVEGVFSVHRGNFLDDAWLIIEDQIKRICDINNMRGVILDEMSRIELKVRQLYRKHYETLNDDNQESQVKVIKSRFKGKQKTFRKLENRVDKNNLTEIITEPKKTDFDTVRLCSKQLFDTVDLFEDESPLALKQKLRNQFAHSIAEYDDENGTVSLKGSNDKYDFEDFKEIRKELIELLTKIEELE